RKRTARARRTLARIRSSPRRRPRRAWMPTMPRRRAPRDSDAEIASLVSELEKAEAYEQRLRQLIVDARDHLAAGRTSMALSILNAALSDIDAATDVVAPGPGRP